NRLGYHIYSYRHFSSRIKGGHTNNNIRISVVEARSVDDNIHIHVALDQHTLEVISHELFAGGTVLADDQVKPTVDEPVTVTLVVIPITEIAKEQGSQLRKNMVAIGASARLMNLPMEPFKDMIHTMFIRKGEEIVNSNHNALRLGFEAMDEKYKELS